MLHNIPVGLEYKNVLFIENIVRMSSFFICLSTFISYLYYISKHFISFLHVQMIAFLNIFVLIFCWLVFPFSHLQAMCGLQITLYRVVSDNLKLLSVDFI